MIPPVIHEHECRTFKFWLSGNVRDGMFYQNELFYRLQTVEAAHRSRLYQRACKLAQHGAVVVTTSEQNCSLWLSLRNAKPAQFSQSESNAEPQTSLRSISEQSCS